MVVKKEESTDTQATIDALMQQIDTLLKQIPTSQSRHLSKEAQEALSAPLDPKFLRQRKGQGGKMFTYADIDYLERRAGEVDPNWGAPDGLPMFTVTPTSVVCNIMICGVPRSATAGYYIPDSYEVWDSNKKQMVERQMTAEVAHTIVTRAQAASERRTFAMFGLGAELWAHNEEQASDFISGGEDARPKGRSEDFREPSGARVDLLEDLGVPASIGRRINAWSRGKDADGKPISDVSKIITALFSARGRDKGPLDRRVWEPIVAANAPYAFAGNSDDDDEDA